MSQCDRILPTCNHCSWASGRECRYTPLPTPAHRGIPRCDRCRRKNLKVWTTVPYSLKATEYALNLSATGTCLFAITVVKMTMLNVTTRPRSAIKQQQSKSRLKTTMLIRTKQNPRLRQKACTMMDWLNLKGLTPFMGRMSPPETASPHSLPSSAVLKAPQI